MSSEKIEENAKDYSAGSDKPETQRMFFALWPDETLRKQIHHHSKSVLRHGGGRQVAQRNLHVTLVFLGNINSTQLTCIEQMANGIDCPPFEFVINKADYWPKPRILWIGPDRMPEVMVRLASDLRDGSINCGLEIDRRPYRAHVTLMRKVNEAPVDMEIRPFPWKASYFALVMSTTFAEGVQYDVIKKWSLSGRANQP